MKDGGVHSDHVYSLNQTQSQPGDGQRVSRAAPRSTPPSCSHPSRRWALGHSKLPPHLFSPTCLPWGPWKSSGRASFLSVPFYLPGLLIKPRSPFPDNVCLHVSFPHWKMNSLQQGWDFFGVPNGWHMLWNIHPEYSGA